MIIYINACRNAMQMIDRALEMNEMTQLYMYTHIHTYTYTQEVKCFKQGFYHNLHK
jgi:hypothetical protein